MRLLSLVITGTLLIGSFTSKAQELIPDQNEKGKWGYVDSSGTKVIDYQYDEADFFIDGKAKVRKGDNYGFITDNNEIIIPIKYNTIDNFNKTLYKVSAGGKYKDGVLFDEKYGFITHSGEEILKPEYEEIGMFVNGVAYIKKGNKYGYINDSIRTIIPCQYAAVGAFNKDGFCWVNDGCSFEKNSNKKIKGGKYGIYDKSGKIILPVKYKTAGTFIPYKYEYPTVKLDRMTQTEKVICTEGNTHRLLRKWQLTPELFSTFDNDISGFWGSGKNDGYKNSVVSRTGEVLFKEGSYDHVFFPEEGFALIKEKFTYNYINISTGEKLLSSNVMEAWAFQNGKAVINDGQGYSLIDKTGKKATATYKNIHPLKDDVYIVFTQNKYGLLDINGNEILKPEYHSIYPSSHGLLRVQAQEDGLIGFIDTSGKYIIEPKYVNAQSFSYGLASVMTSDGWGEIDPSGKEIVKCRWNNTFNKTHDNQQLLWVQKSKGDKWQCLNMTTDALAFNTGFEWCSNFNKYIDGIAVVGTDDSHIGCIDATGKIIIPLEMSNSELAIKAYQQFIESGKEKWTEIDSYRFNINNNDKRNDCRLYDIIDESLWDF